MTLLRAFVFLVALFPFVQGARSATSADQIANIRNLLAHSVVRIDASDCRIEEGGRSCGHSVSSTGFFANVNGSLVIVTTLHGVAYYPSIQWTGGTYSRDTSILYVNTSADIALLAVPQPEEVLGKGFEPLPLTPPLEKGAIPPDLSGHDVVVLGYKLGLSVATADVGEVRITGPGTISSLLAPGKDLDTNLASFFRAETPVLELQNRLDPGDSGGPVIDGGTVVGIAHGGIQGSSLNWAMPAGFAAGATEGADAFASNGTNVYASQEGVIRVFNTDNAQTASHPIVLPLRYSFSLKFSENTSLLMDYGSRLAYTTAGQDNQGDWRFGSGPLAPGTQAYPGGEQPDSIVQSSNTLTGSERALRDSPSSESLILDAIGASVVQLECQTADTLKFGSSDLWPNKDYPALHLEHHLDLNHLALARDEAHLFVYSPDPIEITLFGRKGSFSTWSQTSGPLTDKDLKFALCSINIKPANPDSYNLVYELNKSLLAGSACFAIYLQDGSVLQTAMVGRSVFPELDGSRLYGAMFTMPGEGSDYGHICDE